MVIGTLALTGFPLTAGYFSKDAIIEAAYRRQEPGGGLRLRADRDRRAALTAFYSWRLIFKTFHGEPHDRHHYEEAHESPLVILIPLGVLAAGSIARRLPVQGIFRRPPRRAVLPRVAQAERRGDRRHAPRAALGRADADRDDGRRAGASPPISICCGPTSRSSSRASRTPLYRFLLNKWYFDEIYDFIFVRPALWLGRVLWKGGDGWLIDGFGPDGVSARVLDVTRNVVRLQTGYLYHYAFAMLIGAAALITWFMFSRRGAH